MLDLAVQTRLAYTSMFVIVGGTRIRELLAGPVAYISYH